MRDLDEKRFKYHLKKDNPLNLSEYRPIKISGKFLKKKFYEKNYKAFDLK